MCKLCEFNKEFPGATNGNLSANLATGTKAHSILLAWAWSSNWVQASQDALESPLDPADNGNYITRQKRLVKNSRCSTSDSGRISPVSRCVLHARTPRTSTGEDGGFDSDLFCVSLSTHSTMPLPTSTTTWLPSTTILSLPVGAPPSSESLSTCPNLCFKHDQSSMRATTFA
jgi:hypothetical protein